MKSGRQTTLRTHATVTGVGVHSGLPVSLTIGPASVDAGFIFVRSVPDGCDREVHASAKSVIATEFATVLGDHQGPLVSTAEHVLAALRGMGVDNATIEIDGPEVPIMDGSAAAFVAAIDQAGIVTQSASRRFIPAAVISHAVWLYFRFPLSLRMVEEMLAARGIIVSHESVRQWALKFGQDFANQIRRRLPAAGDKWHLDEVVLKIAGKKHWLWRAVDQEGIVLDILVQSRRDKRTAKRLLRKLLNGNAECRAS